jgi:hypothetical protein
VHRPDLAAEADAAALPDDFRGASPAEHGDAARLEEAVQIARAVGRSHVRLADVRTDSTLSTGSGSGSSSSSSSRKR